MTRTVPKQRLRHISAAGRPRNLGTRWTLTWGDDGTVVASRGRDSHTLAGVESTRKGHRGTVYVFTAADGSRWEAERCGCS